MRTLLAATATAVTALVIGTAGMASAEPTSDPPAVVSVNPATASSVAVPGGGVLFDDLAPIYRQLTDRAKSATRGGGSDVSPLSQECSLPDAVGNKTCFEDYGDKFRVYDGKKDGASAIAVWATDYGRAGQCISTLGGGTWGECNYDMREEGTVAWQTCYQDRSAHGPLVCDKRIWTSPIG